VWIVQLSPLRRRVGMSARMVPRYGRRTRGFRTNPTRYASTVNPARKLATYADLLALSDDARGEIIAGSLVLPPAPLPRHSKVQRSIGRFVGGPFDDDDGRGGPGGWWIFLEVEVRFSPHDIVRVDIGGWRRDRLPKPWDIRPIEVVPDWICEVLSPSNAAHDRVTKRNLYARHGVAHYWIADPFERTLEALQLDASTKLWVEIGSYDATAVARVPPFDAVELELGRLFPPAEA
jgi:Uma2 family endonuclease